jgi:Fur family peroxide stress response transcriptional regulator
MKLDQGEIRLRFRSRGLKVTPQRMAIYQALVETTSHPTAEDLHRRVRRRHPMISPNTVYYTLTALRQAGLVHEVNYWHDRSRFDANVTSHHHLICLGCRTIQDLMDEDLDRLQVARQAAGGFKIVGHRVEFQGYCAACECRAHGEIPRAAGPAGTGRQSARHSQAVKGSSKGLNANRKGRNADNG